MSVDIFMSNFLLLSSGDVSIKHWRLFNIVCVFTFLVVHGDGSEFEVTSSEVESCEMSDDGIIFFISFGKVTPALN
jgi:hypothetical protein